MNSQDYRIHSKERPPEETVSFLKKKIRDMGIEVEEIWKKKSYINTFSLRLVIKGTNIGTSGKGVTKAYALASAYAEFFERYQNNFLGIMLSPSIDGAQPFYEAPDEKIMSIEDVIEDDNELIRLFFIDRGCENRSDKVKILNELMRYDYYLYHLDGEMLTIPYYSVRKKKTVHLPKGLVSRFYGSNGMCAGNSQEEALVQGFSEIIERYVQRRLFLEKPCLPDIPENYIKKHPYIYEMYNKLKNRTDLNIMLKDCSLGGKYPVAALVVIEKNTGNYGIKLGCHPNYAIAMERAFTEATQGNDIFEYAKRGNLDFTNDRSENPANICNSYRIGVGQYPYQIFGNTPTYQFVPMDEAKGKSNAELLKLWTDSLLNMGYDIYIRDNSCLGFPTFHVIIPSISEMLVQNDRVLRAYNTRFYVSSLLARPDSINQNNVGYIIATLNFFGGYVLENDMDSYIKGMHFPGYTINGDNLFVASLCYVYKKDYIQSQQAISILIGRMRKYSKSTSYETSICMAVKYYIEGIINIGNHREVMKYLKIFFDELLCKDIDYIFGEPENIMIHAYSLFSKAFGKEERSTIRSASKILSKQLTTARSINIINQERIGILF